MSRRLLTGIFCIGLIAFAQVPALAQQPTAEAEAPAAEEPESAIKRISLSAFGGYYSGNTFLEFLEMDPRAQLEAETNIVYLFDGTTLNIGEELTPNGIGAPKKEIESGQTYGFRVGFFLSESFHFDLVGSISKARAALTVLQYEDNLPAGRIEVDADEDFTSYMGGFSMTYDAHQLKILGLSPYFGFGLGGIINRFEVLEDKTALYFQFISGLSLALNNTITVDAGLRATTYSFETEELEYSKQVTDLTAVAGLTFLFDVAPVHDYD